MKTYEEMAQSVIRRAKAHKTARNRWIAGSVAAVLALGLCMGVMMADRPAEEPTLQTPPVTVEPSQTIVSVGPAEDSILQTLPSAEAAKHRVTFLYAEGENATEMEQGVSMPCKSELRVLDVAGMTDEEIDALALEEQAYAEGLIDGYPEAMGYGWMQYNPSGGPAESTDHLLTTFIYAGHFVLKTSDVSQVESIRASTKNSVLILPAMPRVDSDEETDPFAYPQRREYCLTGEALKQWYYEPYGGIDVSCALGSGVEKYLNENLVPLSQLSETLTFIVQYVDGTQEEHVIDMIFNDSGEVYALYRGATAVA